MASSESNATDYQTALAIVGMSGRFPGAPNIETFWKNISEGRQSIRFFSDEELLAAGVDQELLHEPNFVRAGSFVEQADHFDASFFGYSPREAEVMDPQHRLFLECCWEALEDAAYDISTYRGLIGVFAGSAVSTYMLRNLMPNKELMELIGQMQLDVGNDRDSLASTISYRLGLRGPALAVQTFCSTSLVALHLAGQSLINYESDIVLAGGVSIVFPQETGYLYEEGGILSPDGVCRTFDARGQGSVMGNGVGVVALKRLADALDDGDHIYAVIRGSAINNDGNTRVSYTAPGVEGEANVISAAQSYAGVHAESISYMEAHGTATVLGDAVELAAMKKAFRRQTSKKGFCAIGSVKPNVGHLDRAAGVTGLMKTALALHHRQIPPSLNFERPDPEVELEQSPFYVNTALTAWETALLPRRAGVSSFGLGGTNAHVVLEEAPEVVAVPSARSWHTLILSAKTESALAAMNRNLAAYLDAHPEVDLADVAYTLQVGRSGFNYRQMLVCADREDALRALRTGNSGPLLRQHQMNRDWPVALFLPNPSPSSLAGIQDLSRQEPFLRSEIERGCALLQDRLGLDLRRFFAGTVTEEDLEGSGLAASVMLLGMYALAQLLRQGGLRPASLWGSEYLAALISGVISLEDALCLMTRRAQLLQRLPAGSSAREVLASLVQEITLQKPTIPYISHQTGTWITSAQATDPAYWRELLAQDAHPLQGWSLVAPDSERVLLELGSGQTLSTLAEQQRSQGVALPVVLSALPAPDDSATSPEHFQMLLGRLWLTGIDLKWAGLFHQRRRLSLPTYPFERKRYWIDAPRHGEQGVQPVSYEVRKPDSGDWFYAPTWRATPLAVSTKSTGRTPYLIFLDGSGVGEALALHFERDGFSVVRVSAGERFVREHERTYRLNPAQAGDYLDLFSSLATLNLMPGTIIHGWGITQEEHESDAMQRFQNNQRTGFYSLLYLVQALNARFYDKELHILALSNAMHAIGDQERAEIEKTTILGAATVIGQEYPHIVCRSVDLESLQTDEPSTALLAEEARAHLTERSVAYRAGKRLVRVYEPVRLPAAQSSDIFRPQGVYLITGGLGRIGLNLAEHLARTVQARLALVGRSDVPARETWADWLITHEPQDATSRKISTIQRIEAAGGQVLICAADVASEEQMRLVLQRAEQTFGALHGVFHVAGITPDTAFYEIQNTGPEQVEEVFRSKVQGLYTLERLLAGQQLDFCLLFSSIASVLGGIGFVAYAAANIFVDAFTEQHNRSSATPWTSVNWDTWLVKDESDRGQDVIGSTVAAYAMRPVEALQALERAITSKAGQLVNSTGDLQARMRQWVEMEGLHQQERASAAKAASAPHEAAVLTNAGDYERKLVAIWQQILGLEQIGLDDNFFDLGGNSLIALQLIARIKKAFRVQISVVTLFEAPTINTMLKFLLPQNLPTVEPQRDFLKERRRQARDAAGKQDIAIIGMAGRFPGARNVAQYWKNLCEGVESISFFSEEELLAVGIDADQLRDPAYVRARPILDDVELFDAAFFGYSPREAELMDPQHRLFLETSWEALESAGYDPQRYKGLIGVFGGANVSTYFYCALGANPRLMEEVGGYQIAVSTDKDSLTTSVSYKLNLNGPSVAVQTFCSTSLVAVHLAGQSLAQGECDMALAGGVSIRVPSKEGYIYEEGGMESPDGHCRTFDAKARGSMFGDGVGVVILKRLADALADGDTIYAVMKGSAMNNDGSLKVSYTAPSVTGQTEVIIAALERAGVSAESIGYVEAHGTATELGDPIEVAALTRAFHSQTEKTAYCALGSVKTNVGHLDRAAGVSGLIKTALALKHRLIPPSLHYETPNPQIDFEHSPFFVNTILREWRSDGQPRRAGLNSLGMGGTNVHVVLEEAPQPPGVPVSQEPEPQLFLISARTAPALEAASENLLNYARAQGSEIRPADVAYTLQVGRKAFEHRRMLVCSELGELATALEKKPAHQVFSHAEKRTERPVVFLFPGVGEQYVGLAQDLYEREPFFRKTVEQCAQILQPLLETDISQFFIDGERQGEPKGASGMDLRALLGRNGATQASLGPLALTEIAQPFTFVVEYALARLLMHWGVIPSAMLGYSLGEYVAACLAGVFSLKDTLTIVARRARWIAQQEHGAMLTVMLSAEEVQPYLGPEIDLAVVNGPHVCVLAGSIPAIAHLESLLAHEEIAARRIDSTHAFHSHLLSAVQEPLTTLAAGLQSRPAQIPYISNVTGAWITAEQTADPTYWATHMCQTVQFATGLELILQEPDWALLEVGPGQTLGSFVKQHPACGPEQRMLVQGTLPARHDHQSARVALLTALGKLWLIGVAIDWECLVDEQPRRRIPLPTYPFERRRYWILPEKATLSWRNVSVRQEDLLGKQPDLADWFYLPAWKQSLPRTLSPNSLTNRPASTWLLFLDDCGIGTRLSELLRACQQEVITVTPGATFASYGQGAYSLDPGEREHYSALLNELSRQKKFPRQVVYLWTVTSELPEAGNLPGYRSDFYYLLSIMQALGNQGVDSGAFFIISNNLHNVTGSERLSPEKAMVMGHCRVIPQEYPNIACVNFDIDLAQNVQELVRSLYAELTSEITNQVVALRGTRRWVQSFEPVTLPPVGTSEAGLRQNGVYMVTGGLGGIGLAIATSLARQVQARLVLVGRTGLPERAEWEHILATHEESNDLVRRIRQVQQLEELGSEVLIQVADIADEAAMREVVKRVQDRFGTIHGVLHTAGVPGIGLMQLKKPAASASILAPKVQGSLVLERVLSQIPLDFLVLFSSMNSTTGGGPGQVDYCAANAFLDVYAQERAAHGSRTIAIDWGEWQWNAWAAGLNGYDPGVQAFFIENRRKIGIAFEEGAEAILRILAQPGIAHVVVSTQNFPALIEASKDFTTATVLQRAQDARQDQPLYERPTLGVEYLAPQSELELGITPIWSELLGIERIGVNDNFFELGGHSLLATQLISRLRRKFHVDLPLATIFEYTTIAELALVVELSLIEEIEKLEEEHLTHITS